MKPVFKWTLAGLAVAFGLAQLTNPARTNPPVVAGHDLFATNPPPTEIGNVLRRACYDCHSNDTKWPWYSRVFPTSWLVVNHVNDGRKSLNFSEWPHDNPQRARKRWNHVAEQVRSGDMPLPSYARIHPPARLTASERDELAHWSEQEAERLQQADSKE